MSSGLESSPIAVIPLRRHSCWIRDFTTSTSFINSPEIFRKWTAISAISSVLQRRTFLRLSGKKLFPNLFVFLVGPPGTGKTQALLPVIDMLASIQSVSLSPSRVTGEKLIHLMSAATKVIPEASGLEVQTAYSIFSEELSVLLGIKDLRLMSSLTAFFDCPNHFSYKTLSRQDAVIQNLALTMAGGITPKGMRDSLGADVFGTGLTSRINFIFSDEKRLIKDLFEHVDQPPLDTFLADLRRINKLFGQFHLEPRAATSFQSLYLQGIQPVPTDARLEEYLPRRHLHLAKLAMVYSAAGGDSLLISTDDLSRALDTLLEAERTMVGAFSGLGASPMIDAIRGAVYWVRGEFMRTGKGVPEAILKRQLLNDVSPQHVGFTLQELVASGQLRVQGEGTGRIYLPV